MVQTIEVASNPGDVNWLNGGIGSANRMLDRIAEKQNMSRRLEENLRIVRIKFERMASDDIEDKL